EGVEGVDALLEAAFDAFPFVGRNDARNQIEGKDAFRAGGIAVDVEGDSQLQQQALGGVLVAEQLAIGERLDDLLDQLIVRPRRSVRLEHLVVKAFGLVGGKLHAPLRGPCRCLSSHPLWLRTARLEGKTKTLMRAISNINWSRR